MNKGIQSINGLLFLGFTLLSVNKINSQCAVPGLVTASPSTFCAVGGTLNLNATSIGNSINWYTVPTGGIPIGSSASGANFSTTAVTTTTYYAESFAIASGTFNYTGGMQTYTVPGGVTTLTVDLRGAKGGNSSQPLIGPGANGGRVTGTIAVTPGQVLNIYIGGQGGNGGVGVAGAAGYNGGGQGAVYTGNYGGGGGGGGTDIRVSPYANANRIAVAGGGGGGAYNYGTPNYDRGGMGGGLSGEGGYSGNILLGNGPSPGGGGTQVSGGATGAWPGYCTSFAGAFFQGGAGAPCNNSGGGGGGGWYGGGGGCWGGGGGGSNYLVNGTHTQGFQAGNGQVIITGNGCVSISRTPVIVTVNPSPTVTITGPTQICIGGTVNLTANGAITYSWSNGSVLQSISTTPTVNTTYTVLGTNTVTGCSSTATQVVAVNALPVITIAGANTLCAGSPLTLTGNGGTTYTWSTGGVVNPLIVTPTVNTTYSVIGTNTVTGCSSTALTNVTVNAVPSVTVTGPYAMCLNQTITLNAFGATTFSWSTGFITPSIAVSPTADVTYTVYGTSPLGCGSSAVVKSITVNPIPVVTANATSTLICKGETVLITASGVDTYSWNTGALTPTISSSPSVNVSYTVTGTNTTTGCYNDATITIFVSPCTGINQLAGTPDSEMKVYPNPNNGEFTVELNNGLPKSVEVYDLTGRLIISELSSDNKMSLSIKELNNGVYYLKIQSNNSIKVVKMIKQ